MYSEQLHQGYKQRFVSDQVIYDEKTAHQHLVIFENALFGRVMMLDGVVQTTQKDEFIYHEMFAHVPLCAHPNPKRVLIIGGGDGGLLREVCRHPDIASIVMVEIDGRVVEVAKQYLPEHSDGAFDDPRLQLVIADANDYIQEQADAAFDVILSDSTDPIGPGEVLFRSTFYAQLKRCLAPNGIVVTQNGVAFLQRKEIATTAKRMGAYFQHQTFYVADVPTYVGGNMHLAWGSDYGLYLSQDVALLQHRYEQLEADLRYYQPSLHHAAFCLPRYIEQTIDPSIHCEEI